MIIQYKYVPTMFVVKKTKDAFLKDFFDKHFHEFIEGKLGLYVSPEFLVGSQQYLQFNFDLDSKFKGLSQVAKDANKLIRLFNNPFDFDVVTTTTGLHMISHVAYYLDMAITDCNHMLADCMSKHFPSIDWKGSVRVTPFGRLGHIDASDFYMNPILTKGISDNIIKRIRKKQPKQIMSEDEWIKYFQTRIIPKLVTARISFVIKQMIDKLS